MLVRKKLFYVWPTTFAMRYAITFTDLHYNGPAIVLCQVSDPNYNHKIYSKWQTSTLVTLIFCIIYFLYSSIENLYIFYCFSATHNRYHSSRIFFYFFILILFIKLQNPATSELIDSRSIKKILYEFIWMMLIELWW